MLKIMNAVDYMKKELKHAEKFLEYAMEVKAHSPELFEVYYKIAENELANAESIHTVLVRMVEKASTGENQPPQSMRDIWAWQHKDYIEDYSHFKAKMEALKKLM